MKKILFTLFTLIPLNSSIIISQNIKGLPDTIPQLISVRNVPRGGETFETRPSDNSEIIKYNIEIKNDSALFTLKTDRFENGVHIPMGFLETINFKRVFKAEKISFEIILDNQNPSEMRLFFYFPGMRSNRPFECDPNKQIKYKKIDVNSTISDWNPLLICYVDDTQNNTEKFIEKYFTNNPTALNNYEDMKSKIFNQIEKCAIIYYNLSNE